jgi:hypothetical protein
MTDLCCCSGANAGEVNDRDQCGDWRQKNLQSPAKRRMKAFNEFAERQFSELVSSFSLTEKWAAHPGDHDEHS